MNAAHLHLILNHLPIFLVLSGIGLLAYGILKNSKPFTRLSLYVIIASAIFTFATMQTGENAEDIVEEIPAVEHDIIEHHEEAAETASIIVYLVGLLALISLYSDYSNHSFKKIVQIATLVGALTAAGFLIHTAYEGGEIRHPEAYGSIDVSIEEAETKLIYNYGSMLIGVDNTI